MPCIGSAFCLYTMFIVRKNHRWNLLYFPVGVRGHKYCHVFSCFNFFFFVKATISINTFHMNDAEKIILLKKNVKSTVFNERVVFM